MFILPLGRHCYCGPENVLMTIITKQKELPLMNTKYTNTLAKKSKKKEVKMNNISNAKLRVTNECNKRKKVRNLLVGTSLFFVGATVKIALDHGIVYAIPCGVLSAAPSLIAREIHKSIKHISKNKDLYIANIIQNKQNKHHIG